MRSLLIVILTAAGLFLISHQLGLITYLVSVQKTYKYPSPHSHRSDDQLLTASAPKGTILLLHGLNFDPVGFKDLAELFKSLNYSTFIPRLGGHRGQPEETLESQIKIWQKQIEIWGRSFHRPLICAGFSMGGLLVLESQLAERIQCDRIILFAPALALKTPDWIVKIARRFMPKDFQYMSGVPHNYRHFDRLGLGVTFSVFDVLQSFREVIKQPRHQPIPPGLVFFDRKDKVISAPRSMALINHHFPDWKIVQVRTVGDDAHANHLIVDRAHLDGDWNKVTYEVRNFLR